MADIRMCFPGGLRKAFTMSYDDGVVQDVRLIKIMKERTVLECVAIEKKA